MRTRAEGAVDAHAVAGEIVEVRREALQAAPRAQLLRTDALEEHKDDVRPQAGGNERRPRRARPGRHRNSRFGSAGRRETSEGWSPAVRASGHRIVKEAGQGEQGMARRQPQVYGKRKSREGAAREGENRERALPEARPNAPRATRGEGRGSRESEEHERSPQDKSRVDRLREKGRVPTDREFRPARRMAEVEERLGPEQRQDRDEKRKGEERGGRGARPVPEEKKEEHGSRGEKREVVDGPREEPSDRLGGGKGRGGEEAKADREAARERSRAEPFGEGHGLRVGHGAFRARSGVRDP